MEVLTLLFIFAKVYIIYGQYFQSLNNFYATNDYMPNIIKYRQPYYYIQYGKHFWVDPARQAVFYGNRWYNIRSPNTIHIKDSEKKLHKGNKTL